MRTVHLAHVLMSTVTPPETPPPPHSSGYLRYYILGALITVGLMAWICLRGYAKGSEEQ